MGDAMSGTRRMVENHEAGCNAYCEGSTHAVLVVTDKPRPPYAEFVLYAEDRGWRLLEVREAPEVPSERIPLRETWDALTRVFRPYVAREGAPPETVWLLRVEIPAAAIGSPVRVGGPARQRDWWGALPGWCRRWGRGRQA